MTRELHENQVNGNLCSLMNLQPETVGITVSFISFDLEKCQITCLLFFLEKSLSILLKTVVCCYWKYALFHSPKCCISLGQ